MQMQTAFMCKFICIRKILQVEGGITDYYPFPNNWHSSLIFPFFLHGGKEVFCLFLGGGESLLFNCALIAIYCSVSFTVLGFSRAEKNMKKCSLQTYIFSLTMQGAIHSSWQHISFRFESHELCSGSVLN